MFLISRSCDWSGKRAPRHAVGTRQWRVARMVAGLAITLVCGCVGRPTNGDILAEAGVPEANLPSDGGGSPNPPSDAVTDAESPGDDGGGACQGVPVSLDLLTAGVSIPACDVGYAHPNVCCLGSPTQSTVCTECTDTPLGACNSESLKLPDPPPGSPHDGGACGVAQRVDSQPVCRSHTMFLRLWTGRVFTRRHRPGPSLQRSGGPALVLVLLHRND